MCLCMFPILPIWFVLCLSHFTSSWTNNPSLAVIFCSLKFSASFLDNPSVQSLTWQVTNLKLLTKLWLAHLKHFRKRSCLLIPFNIFASFSHHPTNFTSLLLLGGWCPILLGCLKPSDSTGNFMKGRVVIGLLSSPLGSGMRPDLIRHQDGPMMDMSFNPFPPGGRNGSWHGRGETPRLIWLMPFYLNPELFNGLSYAIEAISLSDSKTPELLIKISKFLNG